MRYNGELPTPTYLPNGPQTPRDVSLDIGYKGHVEWECGTNFINTLRALDWTVVPSPSMAERSCNRSHVFAGIANCMSHQENVRYARLSRWLAGSSALDSCPGFRASWPSRFLHFLDLWRYRLSVSSFLAKSGARFRRTTAAAVCNLQSSKLQNLQHPFSL